MKKITFLFCFTFFILFNISSLFAVTFDLWVSYDMDGDGSGGYLGIMKSSDNILRDFLSPHVVSGDSNDYVTVVAYDDQLVGTRTWFFNDTEYPNRKSEWRWINGYLGTDENLTYAPAYHDPLPMSSYKDGDAHVAYMRTTTYTTSGKMYLDELWWTPVTLTGNVTVANGRTLTIYSGTTVNLNGYSIECEGNGCIVNNGTIQPNWPVKNGSTIVAQYPSLQSAMSNASSGETVYIYSSSTISDNMTVPSGITLNVQPSITVSVASGKKITVNGTLTANGTYGQITFNSQSGTWYGIEVNSTGNFAPRYCNFNHAQYPITYHSGMYDVIYCDFMNYTKALKYDNYSYGWLIRNTINEYGGTGVEYTQYSWGDIRSYNEIQDNYYGVKIDNTSHPDLGTYAGQGYNSICSIMYDVYSTNASSVNARYNYWGGGDPSIYGNVLWSPALPTDPLAKRSARLADAPAEKIEFSFEETVGFEEFDQAQLLVSEGKTDEALVILRDLINRYPDYNVGRQSLAFEYQILEKEGRKGESKARIQTMASQYDGKEISGVANSIRVIQSLREGDYNQAISIAQDVVEKFPDTNLEKYSLYDLGTIHWYYLSDKKAGEEYFQKLIKKYPKDDLSISALATIGEWDPEIEQQSSQEVESIPTVFQNHPNPFNPATTITFRAAKDDHFSLKVYNIRGQEVAVLLDGHRQAGTHHVLFDAAHLPSGTYFYRLEGGGMNTIKKMILLK